jgi:hypothetical protein
MDSLKGNKQRKMGMRSGTRDVRLDLRKIWWEVHLA